MPEAPNDPGRDETEQERADRNLTDLLQELWVAGLGVEVLLGSSWRFRSAPAFPPWTANDYLCTSPAS
jgi:hypothetical protein